MTDTESIRTAAADAAAAPGTYVYDH